jgi:hypothetical protein
MRNIYILVADYVIKNLNKVTIIEKNLQNHIQYFNVVIKNKFIYKIAAVPATLAPAGANGVCGPTVSNSPVFE